VNREELFAQIKKKKSYLCVGLDTDIEKIPKHLLLQSGSFADHDPLFEFNRQIIDATKDWCVAYKPNLAFYESLGPLGLQSLEKTIRYIPENIFTIADAKRGDIGNTSSMYAKTFFEYYNFDAVTVAPYMGKDSVAPFLEFKNKWAIVLALTSNDGANDFQQSKISNPKSQIPNLYGDVLSTVQQWGTPDNLMFVVGATRADTFAEIRKIVPEHFLLVPGVAAQGGSLADVSKHGMNSQCGLLVNSSRQIIYASAGENFADKAKAEAIKVQREMERYLEEYFSVGGRSR